MTPNEVSHRDASHFESFVGVMLSSHHHQRPAQYMAFSTRIGFGFTPIQTPPLVPRRVYCNPISNFDD
jgi:hypothetical protein